MILQFLGLSPTSGSMLTAQNLEPASDSVSPSLCSFPAQSVFLKGAGSLVPCVERASCRPDFCKVMKSSVLRLSRSPSPSRILGCVQFLYLILFLPFQSKPRPRPGDLIEIFRIGYEHWAIYVEDDCVVHLAPPSEEFKAGSIMSVFSSRALVKYSRLEDVLHGCSWKVNNKLDGTYLPLPVDKIIQRTKKMINKIVQYSLIDGNCEHFVNDLRYGVSRSQQVEHALMEGVKAARGVISAVLESIRPKPVTA
uniref:Phospholipase A and acyltransferase 5 n=1 Tax=Suricata suricatta TaxID=37032 RepID=A0A673VPJ4_SURSU